MGVITKNERNLNPVRTSISEETLYIPSSDDDRSEVSVAVRHAESRVLSGHRVPTVGRQPGPSPRCGKKKSRRYQNATQLITLAEEDEPQEVTIEDFVSSSKTPFTRLLEDDNSLQKWEAFVSSSEEHQQQQLKRERVTSSVRHDRNVLSPLLRTLLKRRSLPLGMVNYLEGQLVDFFCSMPTDIYISPELSSFERMLLHSLSDYHALVSMSFNAEPKNMRLVQVKNPKDDFSCPSMLLSDYLTSVQVS